MFEFPHVIGKSKSYFWIIKELDQSYLFPVVPTPEWVRERESWWRIYILEYVETCFHASLSCASKTLVQS